MYFATGHNLMDVYDVCQVLECGALAGSLDNLVPLLQPGGGQPGQPTAGQCGPASARLVSQAVAILDRPLQEGDSQVQQMTAVQNLQRTLPCLRAMPLFEISLLVTFCTCHAHHSAVLDA